MKYQVVLQWPASTLVDYDVLVEIENLLIERMTGQSKVDGHDFGSGEANIFVHTDYPLRTFEDIRTALSGHRLWSHARIAYRQIDGGEYRMLSPQGGTAFEVS